MITTLNKNSNMYHAGYDILNSSIKAIDLNNKLFCTFTNLGDLDALLISLKKQYTILYNKMFEG